MHFDKIMNQKRSRMNPRLIYPFVEEKAIKSMQPNEDGINSNMSWNYRIFPKFN